MCLFASSDTRYFADCFAPAPLNTLNRPHNSILSAASVGSVSNNDNAQRASNVTDPVMNSIAGERTLYQILGASPTDSRAAIKKKYVVLAKMTHPDAMAGQDPDTFQQEADFAEIAAAWRILANPKERLRYDRELQAKEFTDNVEQMVGDGFKNAMPFFRKTADVVDETSTGFGKAIQMASQRMGKVIDRFGLVKKSIDLEQLAVKEAAKAEKIRKQRDEIAEKRRQMILHTPDAPLTSKDAFDILDSFKDIDKVTLVEKIRLKHPIVKDIQVLEEMELDLEAKTEEKKEKELEIPEMEQALLRAESRVQEAVDVEIEATKRLEEARKEVLAARNDIEKRQEAKKSIENLLKMASTELEKQGIQLAKRKERVRKILQIKEEKILTERGELSSVQKSITPFDITELEVLKREEEYLTSETVRLEDFSRRLRSRAKKLKLRSEELKKEQRDEGVLKAD